MSISLLLQLIDEDVDVVGRCSNAVAVAGAADGACSLGIMLYFIENTPCVQVSKEIN